VLSRALIDEKLVTDSEELVTLCYFFFDDNEEQSSVTTALCALIHQLINQSPRPAFFRAVGAEIEMNGIGLRNNFSAMWNLFTGVAARDKKVICILDGLDKCKPVD
jgi:hypothetical protein